jgi:tetratricopeptide (TPR) repeat protein
MPVSAVSEDRRHPRQAFPLSRIYPHNAMKTRSMRRTIGTFVPPFLLAFPWLAYGQSASALKTNGQVVVYLGGFSVSATDSAARDLATFARLTLNYSLARLSQVRISADDPPSCQVAHADAAISAAKVTAVTSASEPDSAPAEFFLIHGAVERAVKDTAYLVDIEITHCTRHGNEKAFRRTIPVAETAVADELPAVADEAVELVRFYSKLRTLVVAPQDTTLRDVITAALRGSTKLRPVDSLADVRLEVNVSSQQLRVASLTLSGRIRTSRWSIRIPEERGALAVVAERIATEASNRAELSLLDTVSTSATSDSASSTGVADRQKTIDLTRRALCLDPAPGCNIAPEAAAASLSRQRALISKDPELLLLDGRTKLASGDYGSAIAAFRSADSLIRAHPSATLPPDVRTTIAHRLTGEAFRAAGNFAAAVVEYRSVLKDIPGDTSTVLALIESLRSAGRQLEALEVIRQSGGWLRGLASFDSAAVGVVRGMDATTLVERVSTIRDACRSNKSLQAACATAYARRGVDLARSHGPHANVHILLDSGIAYGATDSVGLDAALAGASVAAEVIQFPLQKGAVPVVQNYDRPAARRYLGLASSFLSDGTSARRLEWFHRIRAITAAADGDFDSAYIQALEAARSLPTISSAHVVVNVAITAGLAPASGQLPSNRSSAEWLQVARASLDSSIAKYSTDRTLARLLLVLCANLLNDFQCSFTAAQALMNRGITAPRQILEVVEASVLANRYGVGRDWIARIRQASLSPCDRSLMELFTVWGALQQGDTATAHQSFVNWTSTMNGMEFQRRMTGCWDFTAAEYVLSRPNRPFWTKMISEMIRFTKDVGAPHPQWLPAR